MSFWAGSKIKKSEENAFSWKGESKIMKDPSMKRIQADKAHRKQNIEPRYSGLVLAAKGKKNA